MCPTYFWQKLFHDLLMLVYIPSSEGRVIRNKMRLFACLIDCLIGVKKTYLIDSSILNFSIFWSNFAIGYQGPWIRIRSPFFWPRFHWSGMGQSEMSFFILRLLAVWSNFAVGYRGPWIRIRSQILKILSFVFSAKGICFWGNLDIL